jgi:hypothetical protein
VSHKKNKNEKDMLRRYLQLLNSVVFNLGYEYPPPPAKVSEIGRKRIRDKCNLLNLFVDIDYMLCVT